jgi:hypothetical protein
LLRPIQICIRTIFAHLADQPGGPASTWTGYSSIKQQYYHQGLGRVFPEVWLCELDWKADKLAIDAYPSWYSTYLRCEEERIAQVIVKSERSDKTSTMPQKRLQSPSPLTAQKKKKAKHAGRNPIPVASEIPPAPPPSEISPKALPIPISTTPPNTNATPSSSQTPVAVQTALVDIHRGTSDLADTSSQELGAPELLDISEGKGKEKARESELGSVGKTPPRKVWPCACFTTPC